MWRSAWNVELDKIYIFCGVQLSFNISSVNLCSNSIGNFAHNIFKYIFKQLDESVLGILLPKYLLLHSIHYHNNKKCISVPRVCLYQGSYYVKKNISFKSYLFPWDLILEAVSTQNKCKLDDCAVEALSCLKNNKNNLYTEVSSSYSKNPLSRYQNIDVRMSNKEASNRKKAKMSDDDCILVESESLDNSDTIIVFEKLNSVEIGKEACSSSIRSESLEKTKVFVSEGKKNTPGSEAEDDDVIECTYDSNQGRRSLTRLNDLRQWEYTATGKECDLSGPPSSDKQCFTVMSYNVLSQDLLENHPHLYYDHDPNALSWEYRSERLLEEIKGAAPDILCLQEVQESHLESFYMPRLQELGYSGIFKKRTGSKPDGVAIYYKVSTFKLVEHTSVEFMQPILPVLNRDNVALIARLSSLVAPSLPHLCVATTHLLYNPKRIDVKLAQMQLLLAEIERMAFFKKGSQPSYYPLILTGDLNVTPKSSVYRLLTSGNLWDDDITDKIIDELGITDNCQHVSVLKSRKTLEDQPIDRMSELKQLRIFNSDNAAALRRMEPIEESSKELQEYNIERKRGHLSHNFILNSVYKHRNSRGKEVTTKQDNWVTVDYIFYSCSSREKNWQPVEGNLKLLACYGLMSKYECRSYGPIPNLASPSDHFPLMSKFLLLP